MPTVSRGGARNPLTRIRVRRGQALAELALVLPVLLLLLLGALDLGRLFYSQITITNAAKEAALVSSRGGTYLANTACNDANSVMCAALTEAKGGFVEVDKSKVTQSPSTVVVCPVNASIGTTVSVTVTAPFQLLTPLIGGLLGGQGMTLSATAHAECAVLPVVTSTSTTSSTSTTTTSTSTSSTTTTTSTSTTTTACVAVSFTATDTHNNGHPHRMGLNGSVAPSSSGWTWTWSGAISASGQSPTVDFPASGSQSVTLAVTKGSCSASITQAVQAP